MAGYQVFHPAHLFRRIVANSSWQIQVHGKANAIVIIFTAILVVISAPGYGYSINKLSEWP